MNEPAFDNARFRQVLGHFPTGVCVVAAMHDGSPVGMAIGSFASVSLDPPLVLVCIEKSAHTLPWIAESGVFAVNVLADDQRELSNRFATASSAAHRSMTSSIRSTAA